MVLQGDLYEGAPWVAQALIELLEHPDVPDRALVLDLLVELALAESAAIIETPSGSMTIGQATKRVILGGRERFRVEAMQSSPRAAALARQLMDEVDEWVTEGVVRVSG